MARSSQLGWKSVALLLSCLGLAASATADERRASIPHGTVEQTGYQYDSISRVAGQREPAPPSKFSNEGGFKNSVFDGILGISILTLLDARTPHPTLPFRYVPNCVESVETVVQVCLSGAQAAREPRRTSLLRIGTRESGTGWMRSFMRHFEAGLLKRCLAAPMPADARGKARADDRRVVSGIVHRLKSRGRIDAPPGYGPRKTHCNRNVRWAEKGVWAALFHALAQAPGGRDLFQIETRERHDVQATRLLRRNHCA